ncbi:hypothetical protein [Streptomyces sp. NPDC093261]|uniref:hypothetical protein n=1 Tax=Streptomyces sp. NPDC093261 TaxID=3366037 RepID=UPI00381CAFB8
MHFITEATTDDQGRITVRTRGSVDPCIFSPLPGEAGRQLTQAALDRLHVHGGTWTSSQTLENQVHAARRFLDWLGSHSGVDDLASPDFTPADAWQGVLASNRRPIRQRNFRSFLADTLKLLRPDGEVFASALYGRALPVEVADVQGYAPQVANAIEKVARRRIGDWYQRHRAAVRQALGGLPRDWLHRSATELLVSGKESAFVVGSADLAAAAALLSLIDNKGPNWSVIVSYTADSVERAGDDAAFATGVKARNRRVQRSPAPAGGLFSYGGLLEFVTAATRVARHLRDDGSDFARLLFVPTEGRRVIDSEHVRAWWDTTDRAWPDPAVPRPRRLHFQRLRKAALLRSRRELGLPIVGQSQRTARLYLADALPDVLLIPGLLDVQNSVTEYWRGQTVHIPTPDELEAAEELRRAPAVLDVGVAACTTNGQSPTDPAKPCGLGPVACFVCPNGYRTPETIPGLLAAVQFTDGIKQHSPQEWLAGEAPVLHRLASEALLQFPRPLVAAASQTDVDNARALIACVYLEGRRRD